MTSRRVVQWVLAVVLLAVAGAAHAAHYDLFLLAGQSNMDGRGATKDLVGPLAKWAEPQPDVLISYSNSGIRGPLLTSDGWMPLRPGYSVAPGKSVTELPSGTFGPEVAFGRVVADALPKDRHVAIIKFCEGGTSLKSQWNPAVRGKLYDQFVKHVETSCRSLVDDGHTYTLRGAVWHQGESDSGLPEGEYETLLTGLVMQLRADLKREDLPFVIGEVFDNTKRDRVRAAEKAVAVKMPRTAFASAEGLKTSDKGTHFDAGSQIELGTQMGKAMLGLLDVSSAPTKAP
jgi:iduronate 2-sulfatase